MNDTSEQPKTAIAIVIACIAALLSTMLGIGGGVVMVPLLTLFARMPIKRTAGTSLAVIFLVILVGVIAQEVKAPGDIHWPVALTLAAGAFCGTFIGRWLNKRLPERAFRYAFCVVLIIVGARLLGVFPKTEPFLGADVDLGSATDIVYLVSVGLFAGIVAALFGLGGGVVAVPALALAFGYFQIHFTAARATSLGMILPTSLIGAILHWKAGNVDMKLVARMAPFAVVFAALGVLTAYAVPADTLKVIFGVLLVLASVRLAVTKRTKKS
ncbi:MAG: sulfite exporter TauE/SafE family protein [Planctomycetes bacterium]|nr:sulfite exporter TauE/SafE family protein [Planctomycetota bacterium]